MLKQHSVGVSDFVRRQVRGSGKTYSESLSFEDIAAQAEKQLERNNYRQGYREGVILVPVEPELVPEFVCPLVRITTATPLAARVVRRRPAEAPYIQVRALSGKPWPAGKVELVLYHREVLEETGERSRDTDWELISINAVPAGVESLPLNPVTMMRNQLQLPGGTRANYSSAEWAAAVRFWQEVAALEDLPA